MKELRVLLAEDTTLVRAGFRSLLREMKGVRVVGEVKNGREALSLIPARRPDIVLMDISMPGMNGLEALGHIQKEFPAVKVVILSMHEDPEYVIEALRAGAAGYLLKDSPLSEFARCLKVVAKGETYFSPQLSKNAIQDYQRRLSGQTPSDGDKDSPFRKLSLRQREVLQLIAEGHSNRDIAQIMGISIKTVESHRTGLMKRLDIHEVAGLTRYAIEKGMIKTEDTQDLPPRSRS